MSTIMMEMQQQRAGETDEQTYERAMRDPEVQEIMGDPVMRRESEFSVHSSAVTDSRRDPVGLSTGPKSSDGPHEEPSGQ